MPTLRELRNEIRLKEAELDRAEEEFENILTSALDKIRADLNNDVNIDQNLARLRNADLGDEFRQGIKQLIEKSIRSEVRQEELTDEDIADLQETSTRTFRYFIDRTKTITTRIATQIENARIIEDA